jgi:oxygen-dependent protoporphyrinogen oxidase
VPYVSTASVALGWARADIPHPLEGSGFVVARRHNAMRITACTWVSSKWEERAPPRHALLRAFLGGSHDPAAATLGDDELIAAAVRDVSSALGIRTSPVLARVYRWRDAGAQHNVGHRARMAGLGARLRALPGLFVAGSGFDSIGIPDCVAQGRRAAAEAADYVRIES